MGHAKTVAQGGDGFGFGPGFRAKRMVDGGRFDLARARSGGEEQQGETVRPA